MTPSTAALVFGVLVAVVVLFQLALAAGAPWGHLAMGGRHLRISAYPSTPASRHAISPQTRCSIPMKADACFAHRTRMRSRRRLRTRAQRPRRATTLREGPLTEPIEVIDAALADVDCPPRRAYGERMRRSTVLWLFAMVACDDSPPVDLESLRAPPPGSVTAGVFEGRVPCGDVGDGCQRIKVALTLHRDATTEAATSYVLEWIYVGVDDERHVATGTWSEGAGTPWYATGVVFELADGGAEQFNRFLVLQDRVALFLEPSLDLRVGDAGQAYALSRAR
jgi:hypothetical protein